MRKLIGLTMALALLVAGCSSSTKTSTNTSSPSATSSTGGLTLPDLKGQSMEVAAKWSGSEQQAFQKVLDDFTKRTGASVTFTPTGDQTPTVLGTRITAGNPPDVAILPQPGLLKQFANQGALKELPSNVADLVASNYASVWKDLATVNGKLYGVWFKAANKSTVWYRTDAFQTAGITSSPSTWDDFVKMLGTLRDSGVQGPLSIGGADGWTLTDWFENVYLRSAGADMYDKLSTHSIAWTDPSVIKALQMLGDLWGQSTLIQPNALQTGFPDSVTQVFANKKGAVVYEGDFVAGVITGSTSAKLGTDAKFFPFPSVGGSAPSVVGGGDVATMMKDTPAARALMTYLASPESAEIWAKQGGFTSPNKNVPIASYPDSVSQESAQQLVNANIFRFDMSDLAPAQFGGTAGQGEWKDLQDFLANPADVAGTAQKLEQDAAAAFK